MLEHLSSEEDTDVHPEEILNVLRESDELVKGTSDIADAVGMSIDWTRDSLRDLEKDDRVISQKIGSENAHTLVWGLDPDERQTPIHPEIDRLVKWGDLVAGLGWSIIHTSALVIAVGVLMWISSTTMVLLGISTSFVSNAMLHAYGYSVAGSGGAVLLIGGSLVLLTDIAERVAEYRIGRNRTEN